MSLNCLLKMIKIINFMSCIVYRKRSPFWHKWLSLTVWSILYFILFYFFIVDFRVHSWCCTFCGFGQRYNDRYLSLYHREYFHCPKNTLCFICSSFHPTLGNHWSFYCLYSFACSGMSYSWNCTVCSLFRLASFT